MNFFGLRGKYRENVFIRYCTWDKESVCKNATNAANQEIKKNPRGILILEHRCVYI